MIRQLTGTKGVRALLSLAVLSLFALTLHSVVFSEASLTAEATVGNAFVAGTLSHINSREGTVVLEASKLGPGQTKTDVLTIRGEGDGTGIYTLANAGLSDKPAAPGLSRTLLLTIRDTTTGLQLYTGTVRGFTSSNPPIAIAPGVTHTFQFALQYPLGAANAELQGATMELVVQFTGVSQ
jgi:hypothetical protein